MISRKEIIIHPNYSIPFDYHNIFNKNITFKLNNLRLEYKIRHMDYILLNMNKLKKFHTDKRKLLISNKSSFIHI
jgi:hypothetical protein